MNGRRNIFTHSPLPPPLILAPRAPPTYFDKFTPMGTACKMWENIAGAKRYSRPSWFQHCGGERPRRPRRSDASALPCNLSLIWLVLLTLMFHKVV